MGKLALRKINKVNKPAAAGAFPGAVGLLSQYEKKKPFARTASSLESGGDLLFRAVSSQVPSALKGLTSVFGMGTGGTPSPLPPEIVAFFMGLRSVNLAFALSTHSVLPKEPCCSSESLSLSRNRHPLSKPRLLCLDFRLLAVPAFRAAHPFGFAFQRIKFRRVLRFRPGSFADLLASAFSHLDNRTLFDENLSFLDLRLSFLKLSPRPISISKLVCYHTYTADLSPGSPPGVLLPYRNGNLILEVSFTLRCFQRLSPPHFASLLCRWHDNSCTSGASIPVLSY